MNDVESLKSSIKSAEDLGSVARTMKTLAAVNIRQYEAAVESLRQYSHTIRAGMSMLLHHSNGQLNDRISPGSQQGIIVFGSDQGMCGRFNQQVAQFTVDTFRAESPTGPPVICVGNRAADSLIAMDISISRVFTLPGSADGMSALVHELLPVIDEWRTDHDIGRIVVVHNRRQTASTWRPHAIQLLPLNLNRLHWSSENDYESHREEPAILDDEYRSIVFSHGSSVPFCVAVSSVCRIAGWRECQSNRRHAVCRTQHQRTTAALADRVRSNPSNGDH